MSGPKVITVVTRQEMVEACQVTIAQVDHAIALCKQVLESKEISAQSDLDRFRMGRDSLSELLTADRFLEVAQAALQLIEAIQDNLQQHLALHEAKALQKRRQERSLRFSAEMVINRSKEASVSLPAECLKVLSETAAGRLTDSEIVQRAMQIALAALNARSENSKSTKQSDLAISLGASADQNSASHLLKIEESSLTDTRITQITSKMGELTRCGDDSSAAAFHDRLEIAAQAADNNDKRRSDLLLTSIEVDLAARLKRTRQIHEVRKAIEIQFSAAQALNELDVCQPDLDAAKKQIEIGNLEEAGKLLAKVKDLRTKRSKTRAAQASRAAILQGLKELGYSVQEGMTTKWAAKNQILVRHPTQPGVAVELAGGNDSSRVQARMVSVQGAARGPRSDREIETQWCSQFQLLQAKIAQAGGELRIEKSTAAGEHPLKMVADPQEEDERRQHSSRERSL